MAHLIRQLMRRSYWQSRKCLRGYGLPRFRLVRFMDRLIQAILRSDVADVLGHRMYLGRGDVLRLSTEGIYEPRVTELVQREVEAGDVVLDIGAHVGYYTLIFAQLVGGRGRVFAFEPEPKNFALLESNVRVNGYHNVTLIRKAVSDKTRKVRLCLSEDNSGDNRIYDSLDGRRSVEVETLSLDDYFAGYQGRIDFIKMDIQGAEPAALRGMAGLLAKNAEVKLITEFWPLGLKLSGVEPETYLRLLVDRGFTLSNIDEQQNKIVSTSIPELLTQYTPERSNQTNLLCVITKSGNS